MNPYENLANAIVLKAVRDYRDVIRKLSRKRKNTAAKDTYDECLRFFRSEWFGVLTELDPEKLIQKLNEEVGYDG